VLLQRTRLYAGGRIFERKNYTMSAKKPTPMVFDGCDQDLKKRASKIGKA
jgi:hypothetical protein